uniref:F-box domain-containing protein n=1 Tax=Caenorhabditis tropicalis TaxID=1561998 RepID=A0A1I7UI08_9PELO
MNLEKELSDLKISSSEIPPNLCDLPVEIVDMIVKKLDFPERVKVGRVCKTLQKMVNRLKPYRVNDIKITFDSEECEMKMDGYTIKYKKPKGESLVKMINRMFDDLITLLPDCQVPNFTIRINGYPSYKLFRSLFLKRVPQPLTVHTYFMKALSSQEMSAEGGDFIKREMLRVAEYHFMDKLEDDIMKVKVFRLEPTEEDECDLLKVIDFIKYFREGQEDIYVDDPELLPPKEQ